MTYSLVLLALGWISPSAAAAPVEEPQISYETHFETYQGEEWRSKLHHDLVPVAHQGMATVWTLDESKLAQLRGFANKDGITLPKVTAFENAEVNLSDVTNRQYVAWSKLEVTGDKSEYKPTTRIMEDGLRVKLAGRTLDQGVLTKVKIDFTNFLGFSVVQVKEPIAHTGKPNKNKDGIYHRPYIEEMHIAGEWLVPKGSVLVVGFGPARKEEKPSEYLLLIQPRRVLTESEEQSNIKLPQSAAATTAKIDAKVMVASHPVETPAEVKVQDAPPAAQTPKVMNAGPTPPNYSQISYETSIATYVATEWRTKLHHDLVSVAHKGAISVWTLDASKLPALEAFSSDPLVVPKVTTLEDMLAVVSTVKPKHFVSWTNMIVGEGQVAFQPITDKLDDGLEVQLRGRLQDQGILSKVKIDYLDFVGYNYIQVKGPKKVDGKKVNLLSHGYQIPSINEAHIEGEWLIPNDRVLVVGLGLERGDDDKLCEKLVVIKPQKAMLQAEEKTTSVKSPIQNDVVFGRNSAPAAAVAVKVLSDSKVTVASHPLQAPAEVKVQDAPPAAQPLKVVNAGSKPANESQISYETKVATFEGTEWRTKLHTDLVHVNQKGKVSVWTIDAEKLAKLQSFTKDKASAPRITALESSEAVIKVVDPRYYISWAQPIYNGPSTSYLPSTKKADDALNLTVSGRCMDQGLLAKIKIDDTTVIGMAKVAVEGRSRLNGKPIQQVNTNYQVPAIEEAHVEGEWLIPTESALVIGLGAAYNAEGRLREKVVVVMPQRNLINEEEKTTNAPAAPVKVSKTKSDSQLEVTSNDVRIVGQVPPPVASVAVQAPKSVNRAEAKKALAKTVGPDEVIGVDFDFDITTDGKIALDMGRGLVTLNLGSLFSQANAAVAASMPVAAKAGVMKPAPMPSRSTPVALDSTGVVLPPLPGDSKVTPAGFDASGKPLPSAQAGHVMAESSENRPMTDKTVAKASIPQHSEINIFQGAAPKAPKQIFVAGGQLDPAKLVQLEEQTIKIPVAKGLAIELKAKLIPDVVAAKPTKLLNDVDHCCELGEDCDEGPCCEINKAKNR